MPMQTTRREIIRAGCTLGAALPFLQADAVLADSVSDAYILGSVNPELRPAAAKLLADNAYPPLTADNLAYARSLPPPPLDGLKVPVQKRVIAGAKGQPEVIIYVVNPRPAGSKRPALLHTHGGGYILGTASGAIRDLQDICLALDCPAVTVEYRLAPETTYAGSIEDNYAGLKWLHDHAEELGADPARIAVIGESAGGGHAALLAITARDRGEVPLAFQCLIYPMLDDRTGTSRKLPHEMDRLIWTAKSNHFGWKSFLGMEPGGPDVPAAGVPARVSDLQGLPPAFIGVGSIDLFMNEDVDYARRLIAAGVPTELLVVPGAFHGFDTLAPQTHLSRQFRAAEIDALRTGLGLGAPSSPRE
ncbi:alpha/beta hydrolase [Novosphingobium beihaiensis]|uniref:Alpha/beta hydrolase n=1 Tax=Novosphingobium beihaiensis TaxID=2930389 RepID=A0ABT0BLD3_9SPHN|nr:alpha/beta hydrolase [Novosphingobium beihaiensis]MCJ2185847.1 alpha/beta hydrolase [Novosphingobium beihaiensis]